MKDEHIEPSICPDCGISLNECGCNQNCPSCNTKGDWQKDHIICPNEDCRVMRFFTQ